MNVRTICLAILFSRDATGYEIRKQSTEGQFSYFVEASYGAIYPALARLEEEGLVTCTEQAQPGKPARKIYSITDAGRHEFVTSLSELPQADTFRSEFLLIAKCAELLDPTHVTAVLDHRIAALREELEHFDTLCGEMTGPGAKWTVAYGRAVHSASLAYLENNREELQKIAGTQRLPETVAAE